MESTDILSERLPGVPEMESRRTIESQHRLLIAQSLFGKFYQNAPHALKTSLLGHEVLGIEFSDIEGKQALSHNIRRR